jgi:hypothetical protein
MQRRATAPTVRGYRYIPPKQTTQSGCDRLELSLDFDPYRPVTTVD